MNEPAVLRDRLLPGDLGSIVALHGITYAREHGFDTTFEAYVAGPLAEFVRSGTGRLWIADRPGRVVGSVAVVDAAPGIGQLRWFLVAQEERGAGLGRRPLTTAIDHARASGQRPLTLWTVSALETAARLYRSAGFELREEHPFRRWGVAVVEQRYELELR